MHQDTFEDKNGLMMGMLMMTMTVTTLMISMGL